MRKPGNQLLAALLGIAIGVMATLSLAEMFVRNAVEHGWKGITAAVVCGATTYYLLHPYFPDFEQPQQRRLQACFLPEPERKAPCKGLARERASVCR